MVTTLSIAVPPGQLEEILKIFWLVLAPVREEPGCLSCELYEQKGNGEALFYMEEWETAEQLERHMRSARYELLLAIMEASAEPPVLRYQLVATIKGMEYLEAVRLGGGAGKTPASDQPNPNKE